MTMKRIQVGSRVRIVGGGALHAATDLRPEPGQMLWAGREASVTGYRQSPDDRSLYALKGAPGLWLEEWIDPI
jgi:hypothetical protein